TSIQAVSAAFIACISSWFSWRCSRFRQRRRPRPRLRLEAAAVDAVLPHLVAEDALGGVEQARRLRAVAARRLERVEQDVPLERLDVRVEREARQRAAALRRLQ